MDKIVAILLIILFAVSIMACATSPDKYQAFCEQSYGYRISPTGYDKAHQ